MCNGLPISIKGSFYEAANGNSAEQIALKVIEAAPWESKLCPMIQQCHTDCMTIMRKEDDSPEEYDVDVVCQNDHDCFTSARVNIESELLNLKCKT